MELTKRVKISAKRTIGPDLLFAARLTAVLLFCFIALFQTFVPHHHSDGLAHADCPYCAFSAPPVMPTADGGIAPFVSCTIFPKPPGQAFGLTSFYGSSHVIRAPPALS